MEQNQSLEIQPGPMTNFSVSTESARAIQEVQGQIVMAKKFPRSIPQVIANILEACKRKTLAESAVYSYPRGGQEVSGPSIRLAEELARNFGNLDFGIKELEQRDGESLVMAYCWDLETNTRQQKTFTVKHERDRSTAKGGNIRLTAQRDIYELVANNGARRLRACILGVIPKYIVDEALDACDETLRGSIAKEPLIDLVTRMIVAFKDIGIPQELIEERLGHKIEATTNNEVLSLRKIFNSLRDSQSSPSDWFNIKAATLQAAQGKAESLTEKVKNATIKPLESAEKVQGAFGDFQS